MPRGLACTLAASLCLPCAAAAAGDLISLQRNYTQAGPPAKPNFPLPWGPSECFVKATWNSSEVQVQLNLSYGIAYHPLKQSNQTLMMDLYHPPSALGGDRRPAVILVHGGSFIKGSRRDMDGWARILAARGYVAAAIDYRIIPIKGALALYSIEPVELAVEDARAAVRFLRRHASRFGIDTNRMALAGASAGALTAMYYAYVLTKGDGSPVREGESGNPGYPSVVNAVLSISGGLVARAFCMSIGPQPDYTPRHCLLPGPPRLTDMTGSVVEGSVPGMDMHGTADQVIPFANAMEFNKTAAAMDVIHELLVVPGASHVPKKQLFDPKGPYLLSWLRFLSGALNLASTSCPSTDLETSQQMVVV